VLALFYGTAGFAHLVAPDWFVPIVPDGVPFPFYVVVATGLCEIAGAFGVLSVRLRRFAGAMLALYALCVWPANIKHALMALEIVTFPSVWWYHAPRLALQPVLIWWALHAGGWFEASK
jgi:uncharacterized membrane protein